MAEPGVLLSTQISVSLGVFVYSYKLHHFIFLQEPCMGKFAYLHSRKSCSLKKIKGTPD